MYIRYDSNLLLLILFLDLSLLKLTPLSCPFTGITELSFPNSVLATVLNSKVTYTPLMLPLPLTAPTALMFLKPSDTFSPVHIIPQILPLLLSGPIPPLLLSSFLLIQVFPCSLLCHVPCQNLPHEGAVNEPKVGLTQVGHL